MLRPPRWLGARATRIFVLVSVVFLFFFYQPTCINLKAAPTNFSSLFEVSDWPPDALIPQHLVRQQGGSSGLDIDDRYVFIRYLGNGREGAVSIYHDTTSNELVAIKRFQSVYRNPVPAPILQALGDDEVNYWPAEIQATILLGGFRSRSDESSSLAPELTLEELDLSMLPVLDYFLVRGTDCCTKPLTWHLVTPYLGKGTLTHLAKRLQTSNQTSNAVDYTFRPAFYRLLSSLSRLHKLGVCHNDVKPDNIYILAELHWLLGDLGNVREIHHPYYLTPQWHREGQWSDCQTNDVRRALISYLALIRRASADTTSFDQQFLCRSSPVAKLYWQFMEQPVSAESLLHRLESRHSNATVEGERECLDVHKASFWSWGKPSTVRLVDKELRWSTIYPKWKFWIR